MLKRLLLLFVISVLMLATGCAVSKEVPPLAEEEPSLENALEQEPPVSIEAPDLLEIKAGLESITEVQEAEVSLEQRTILVMVTFTKETDRDASRELSDQIWDDLKARHPDYTINVRGVIATD